MEKPRVLYVDAFNYFYSQFNTNQTVNTNGEPIGGFVGMVDQIQRLVVKFRPQRVVVVLDGPDAGLRRRQVIKEYKSKRGVKKRMAKLPGAEGVEIDNSREQLINAYDFLRQLPLTVIVVPLYEADDVIVHLAKMNPECENILCTSDKDYLQAIDSSTYVWSWGKKLLYDRALMTSEYNVLPENYAFFRSITGDPSDELIGVKGIGTKTLHKIMDDLHTTVYKDFDDFWNKIETIDPESITDTKARNKLTMLRGKYKEAKIMYSLMKLTTENLSSKALDHLDIQLFDQEDPKFSQMNLKVYLERNNLNQAFPYFDKWLRPFISLKRQIILYC